MHLMNENEKTNHLKLTKKSRLIQATFFVKHLFSGFWFIFR
ncbi:Hypothetical protein MCYN_0165 [Mycoplasmopsis cynos C142]|uniref:Uncharacterized protein n=1 Tax=Mycoplasmopsis cynos (strain C142) TaxID=1246955 RepID=L0RV49_MYCC1|nr:Hypothetical protein MCYN_0165 [Mycoplasmopsis cynos C142]